MDHAGSPHGAGDSSLTRSRRNLRRELRGWQIFFIVASTIIGEGVFSGDRQALEVAGPAGTLLGLVLMGVLVICVMEGVSEFVQLFAVPNAIFEYIRAFVDEDLAWCCGVAYWYTWASVFAALNLTAANFSDYWGMQQTWKNIAFFVLSPLAMFGINMVGVKLFGWVESIGGFLKLVLVFGTGAAMYHLYSVRPDTAEPTPFYDGFRNDPGISPDKASAVCFVIPLLAYSFLGAESVAMTAFEAADLRSLRVPSQIIAYVVTLLYAFTLISEMLLISWKNPELGSVYGNITIASGNATLDTGNYNMPVIAAYEAGYPTFASFLNGCYIYSVLSASNSALYVSSRTLYGLTRDIKASNWFFQFFKRFNRTIPQTGVPGWAVLGSMLAFFWFPFVSNVKSTSVDFLFSIMEVTASVMCLIVWAALSLAFIRFNKWVRLCSRDLPADHKRYDRTDPFTYEAMTALSFSQPLPAWIGLIGSLLVVFVLTTASWWNGAFTGPKFGLAYAGPIVILALWLGRKVYMWPSRRDAGRTNHGWVVISSDVRALVGVLDRFDHFRPTEDRRRRRDSFRARHPWLQWYHPQPKPPQPYAQPAHDSGVDHTWAQPNGIALDAHRGLALAGPGLPHDRSELPAARRGSGNQLSLRSAVRDGGASARPAPTQWDQPDN